MDIPSGWDVEQGPPAEGVTLQPGTALARRAMVFRGGFSLIFAGQNVFFGLSDG